ncbi:cytochrome P450 [Nocardia sp. NPDC052278]|uniref:cytochrome P450 n=1 Tax=unclassified Nocardia TaxID=2637762 RepID=UPI00367F5D7D
MTTPRGSIQPATCPVAHHTTPVDIGDERVSLYLPEFAEDPHRAYRQMRERYGSLVPVDLAPGVPATLVIGYRTGVRILNDPEHFPADPRTWQKDIPADCPVLPILEWRPSALRTSGIEHVRYRQATTASIKEVDLHALHATVEQIAIPLINGFCEVGTAELISQYAFPLVFGVMNVLMGCPPALGQQIATTVAALLDGIDTERNNKVLAETLMALVALKRAEPGDDIATRLLQHPSRFDDIEMLHQLAIMYGAGIEPMRNLIGNTLGLMLTDDRFAGDILGGSLLTRDALDEVLFTDPPIANLCASYPRHPILIDNVWLPAHQPVLISTTGCNTDPSLENSDRTGNRSHLAWSAGPHACPARIPAYLIVQDAIDQLLDALPEMRLAVLPSKLSWRPGPFHRALTDLPVVFPPGVAMVVKE